METQKDSEMYIAIMRAKRKAWYQRKTPEQVAERQRRQKARRDAETPEQRADRLALEKVKREIVKAKPIPYSEP